MQWRLFSLFANVICTIFNKPGFKASPYHNLENGLNQTCFSMSSCFVQLLFWIFRNFKSFLLTVVSSPLNGFSTHPSSHPDLSLLFGKTSFLYPTPFLFVDGYLRTSFLQSSCQFSWLPAPRDRRTNILICSPCTMIEQKLAYTSLW